jgi:hypothetical protein
MAGQPMAGEKSRDFKLTVIIDMLQLRPANTVRLIGEYGTLLKYQLQWIKTLMDEER